MPALALLLVLPTTWIVDANNGPGTNFLDLPAAVAAAQSGDTILVRAGTYTRFAVSGKALTIRGAGASSTIVALAPVGALAGASVVISATPPGETFYLGGLTVRSNPTPALGAMEVYDAKVVVTDCTMTGINGTNNGDSGVWVTSSQFHASRSLFQGAPGAAVLGIVNSGATIGQGSTFAADACTFEGGSGVWLQGSAYAGHGIAFSDASVTLMRCDCRGGGGPAAPTSHGGSGAYVYSGTLRVAGTASTIVRGGVGGTAAPAIRANIGTAIVHGPVTLVAPATSGAVVTGAPPLPYLDVSGSAPEPSALLPVTVDLDGILPNALYVLAVADAPGHAATAPWGLGEVLVSVQAPVLHFGLLDANGRLTFSFTPASVPALVDRPVYSQAAVFDAAANRFLLSQASIRVFAL